MNTIMKHIYVFTHTYTCIYIHIYIYIYTHTHTHTHTHTNIRIYVLCVHTPAVAHDMQKAHPVTLWVEEHLRRMHLNRRGQIAYQQLPVGLRIPLRMHRCLHSPWKPVFEMAASKRIAVRNRDFLVPFLKVEVKQLEVQKCRGVRFYYTCILSPLETSHPTLFHHDLICQWLRKACHWIQNSGMHVAATHTDRYKEEPSGTLPRQTSQLKPMHSRSSLPLPWFPKLRVNRNEGSQEDDDQRTDSARRNLTRSLKHTHPECLYPFLYIFLFTSTIGP